MSPYIIARSIVAHLQTDTGAGGIYEGSSWKYVTGGIWHASATPSGSEPFPYGVFTVEMAQAIGMTDDRQEVTVTFELYDKASNAFGSLESAAQRIYGNAIISAGRVPTYGLHRANSITVTGTNTYSATLNSFICQSQSASRVDENVVSARMVFTCALQVKATNP